ncbi:unnamed protein product [Caenorhabditis auriculariae]|uniref:BTB domain-containing protein n=1 Tax=Caenorhabditis auriculariae TaxID=2777116 RepID=A0A8S1GNE1_9PELO|nr:unnamed protein product [Caenorhabditis auriculariae]
MHAQFVHSVDLDVERFKFRAVHPFATVYLHYSFSWNLEFMKRTMKHGQMVTKSEKKALKVIQLSISLRPSTRAVTPRLPMSATAVFHLRVLNEDRTLFSSMRSAVLRFEFSSESEFYGFRADGDAKFVAFVSSALLSNYRKRYTFEFVCSVKMLVSEFGVVETAASQPSVCQTSVKNFVAKAENNLVLQCIDGKLLSNRELLFVASVFFRNLFLSRPQREVVFLHFNVASVELALSFLLYGYLPLQTDLSPNIANQIVILSKQFECVNFPQLASLIQDHGCKQASRDAPENDLHTAVEWLLLSAEQQLHELWLVTSAKLVTVFWDDYLADYADKMVFVGICQYNQSLRLRLPTGTSSSSVVFTKVSTHLTSVFFLSDFRKKALNKNLLNSPALSAVF